MRVWFATALLIAPIAFMGLIPPARAQWVVVDPTAVTQLLVQVQQLQQEISVAQQTFNQAKQAYNAMTGTRGMQSLLPGVNRNYLPSNWAQLSGAMTGAGGMYAALGADVNVTVNRNAILSSSQIALLSANEVQALNQRRQAAALREALARAALSNYSGRFSSLQGFVAAIPTATDQKAVLDLLAREAAEQAMLTNDQSKLATLYQAAQVAAETERERADEKAIADIGRLNQLPPMGLGQR